MATDTLASTSANELNLGYKGEDYSAPIAVNGRTPMVTKYPTIEVQDIALPEGTPSTGCAEVRYRVRRIDAGSTGGGIKPSFSLEITDICFPDAESEGDETDTSDAPGADASDIAPGSLAAKLAKVVADHQAADEAGPDV